MKAYSMDLRQRVINDCDAGMKTKTVADKYSVSPAWVRRLKQHRRERGHIQPLKPNRAACRKIDRDQLKQLITDHPDATLAELREMMGNQFSRWSIARVLHSLGFSFKKRRYMPPNKTGPTLQKNVLSGD